MSDSATVCVVGSTMIDLVTKVARMPALGETIEGRAFAIGYGGKGGNQAVMAARLGAPVVIVTRLGCDYFGDGARANYVAADIDVRYVVRDAEHPTGVAPIFVDDSAQNCIVIVPGANTALAPADAEAAAPALRSARVVIGQLEVPAAATLAAFRIARAAGVVTVFNPAPAGAVPDELWQLTDVAVPNETEAEVLTGRPVADDVQAEAAARILIARGAGAVCLTLGERGSMVVTPERTERIETAVVAAVDTTGAGDAYVGTLAVCLSRGFSLADAARRAGLVAALSVTKAGTQTSFPGAVSAAEFLGGYGLTLYPEASRSY